MKTHEKLLTAAEKIFTTIPAKGQTAIVTSIAPVLITGARVLSRINVDHPEIGKGIRSRWMVIVEALTVVISGGGDRLITGIAERAPDCAPTLYAAIQGAKR